MGDPEYAILCVDDDKNILQMLSFQLDKIIDTKKTLLEYYTNPIDCIPHIDELAAHNITVLLLIVDFQMPQMNGAQLIRELKKKKTDLNCIMLSGQANAIQVNELIEDNLLNAFIHKPWDEEKLIEVIKPLLSQYAILCEN